MKTKTYARAGLLANRLYSIKLRSVSKSTGLTSTTWSTPITGRTASIATAPTAMLKPILNQATDSTLHCVWEPPLSSGGSPLVGYRIYVYTVQDEFHHGINGTTFVKLIMHANTFGPYEKVITGLLAKSKYEISVAAYNGINRIGEESPRSTSIFTAPPTAPTAPRSPAFVEIGSSWFRIAWRGPVDTGGAIPLKYRLRLRQYIGNTPISVVILQLDPSEVEADDFGMFRYRISSLLAVTKYDFAISGELCFFFFPVSVSVLFPPLF